MAAEQSPAFQFYPKDFITDGRVATMSAEEVGIYIRLLCYCWTEGSIPDDLELLARIGGVTHRRMQGAWLALQFCFQPDPKAPVGWYVQPRIERERAKQAAFRQKQAENGRKGGRPPSNGKPVETQALPNAQPKPEAKESSPSSSPSPVRERDTHAAVNGNGHSLPALMPDEGLRLRAGAFIEDYPEIYARCREGATYRVSRIKMDRDLEYAYELVQGWDDQRLRAMLEVFLRRDDRDANNRPGTPGQFLNMAPDCDRLLRSAGR